MIYLSFENLRKTKILNFPFSIFRNSVFRFLFFCHLLQKMENFEINDCFGWIKYFEEKLFYFREELKWKKKKFRLFWFQNFDFLLFIIPFFSRISENGKKFHFPVFNFFPETGSLEKSHKQRKFSQMLHDDRFLNLMIFMFSGFWFHFQFYFVW